MSPDTRVPADTPNWLEANGVLQLHHLLCGGHVSDGGCTRAISLWHKVPFRGGVPPSPLPEHTPEQISYRRLTRRGRRHLPKHTPKQASSGSYFGVPEGTNIAVLRASGGCKQTLCALAPLTPYAYFGVPEGTSIAVLRASGGCKQTLYAPAPLTPYA